MSEERFVVVTTKHRGVFAGVLVKEDGRRTTLKHGRCCVYWSASVRGFVGLAHAGPDSECRVTPAAPQMVVTDVTCTLDCTEESRTAWESEPWA